MKMMITARMLPSTRLRLLRIWPFVAAITLFLNLGAYPLIDSDEGRNAEIGREMAASNNYLLPYFNGLPYVDKPILYFAAQAAAMELLGPTEMAARLPALLFTLLTVALVAWFARRVWDADAAVVAAVTLISMPLTVGFARTVIFDSALTFFIVLAIISFYFAIESGERRWPVLAWAAMALGVLTKGPVAIALPLLVAIPFAIWRKRFRALWSIVGSLLFLAIVLPWVWAVSQVVPDFLEYVLVTETVERMSTDSLMRSGPPWYFIPYLLAGALPWSIVVIASRRAWWRPDPTIVYLLLWIGAPFILFSLSRSKQPQYILPLIPPMALLVASCWREMRTRAAAIAHLVVAALLLIAPLVFHRTKMRPEIAAVADGTAIALGVFCLAAGICAIVFARRRELAIVVLTIPILAMPSVANPLLVAIGERRSTRSFIARLAPHLTPGTKVIGVEAFTGSMAFYLRAPLTVATEDGSEWTSNYVVRRFERFAGDTASTLRSLPWFERDFGTCCVRRIYIVRNKDEGHRRFFERRGLPLIARGAHHSAYGPWVGPGGMGGMGE
jgi:4-amino-4-deoxy-L-arabinose transferase-like glycosyltransferase